MHAGDRSPHGSEPAAGKHLPLQWSRELGDYVTCLTCSADGARVAAAMVNGELQLLDGFTGATLFRAHAHPGGILAAAYSPTSDVLATAGQDGVARLFDASGKLLAELPGGGGWVEHVAWSPRGERVATTAGRTVRVWSPEGRLAFETAPDVGTITGVAWDRAGRRLATCCFGGARIFDAMTGAELDRLPTPASLISLCWSADGTVIACGTQECSVRFWRLRTGKVSDISGFTSKPRALNFAPNRGLLAAGGGKAASVWSFEQQGPEGRRPLLLEGHEAVCTVLAFSPDGRWLATGGDDARVLLWAPQADATVVAGSHLRETVTALAWRQSDCLITADASGLIETRELVAA